MINFIKKQIYDINKGGLKIFLFKLYIFNIKIYLIFYFILSLVISFFPLIFLQIISKFFLVRIGKVDSNRIGHFTMNIELYLCQKNENINQPTKKTLDIFFHDKKICNYYFKKIVDRNLNTVPRFIFENIYFIIKKLNLNKFIASSDFADKDFYNLLETTNSFLSLTKDEIKLGRNLLLENYNISHDSKIVCVTVRDNEYLKITYPNKDWSYHDYRNCEINNYIKSIEFLIDQGYYVFRVGKITNKKINLKNPKLIDYANSKYKSDFLDIYLASACEFFINGNSGIEGMYALFRKPILRTNFTGMFKMDTGKRNHLYIFKLYKNISTKKLQPFSLEKKSSKGYFDTNDLLKENLSIIENTSEEILISTKEFLDLIIYDNDRRSNSEKELENKFRDMYTQSLKDGNFIYSNNLVKTRVCTKFLLKYKELIV